MSWVNMFDAGPCGVQLLVPSDGALVSVFAGPMAKGDYSAPLNDIGGYGAAAMLHVTDEGEVQLLSYGAINSYGLRGYVVRVLPLYDLTGRRVRVSANIAAGTTLFNGVYAQLGDNNSPSHPFGTTMYISGIELDPPSVVFPAGTSAPSAFLGIALFAGVVSH